MILTHAKHIAEDYTEQKPLRDIVLTVPAFFNQAERRALKGAVELAGLNLLQLITEPMAVSLNYGMFRRKEINGTAKHLMFYDMGAYDTTVSIVGYTVVQTKERGFSEKHPQAQILGLGYDRSLGGLELQIKLREHLATKFMELKKPKTGRGSIKFSCHLYFTKNRFFEKYICLIIFSTPRFMNLISQSTIDQMDHLYIT